MNASAPIGMPTYNRKVYAWARVRLLTGPHVTLKSLMTFYLEDFNDLEESL